MSVLQSARPLHRANQCTFRDTSVKKSIKDLVFGALHHSQPVLRTIALVTFVSLWAKMSG